MIFSVHLVSTAAARYRMNRTGLKQSPYGTPMLVFIFSPVVFPHLTFRFMLLISMYSMCSSSSGRIDYSSSNNDLLWTVSTSNCNKMAELQQIMQALLLIAYSSMVKTKNTNSGAVTGCNQETPTTYVYNTMNPTDKHQSSAGTINPKQNESHEDANKTESVNIGTCTQ